MLQVAQDLVSKLLTVDEVTVSLLSLEKRTDASELIYFFLIVPPSRGLFLFLVSQIPHFLSLK